jgi:Domain of unknown function (DUF4234)
MAEEIAIGGTGATAKVRNPWGVVGLSIITLGIYYLCWWYFINREMRDFGRARSVDLGQNPVNSLLAASLGWIIIVPALVTQETAGIERGANGPVVFILLLIIGPVGLWYAQNELNKAWAAQASGPPPGLPATETSEAPSPPPPPPAPAEPPRPEAPGAGPQAPQ